MEPDGVTRFYEFADEIVSEVYPSFGEPLSQEDAHDVIARADLVYSCPESPSDPAASSPETVKALWNGSEFTLRETGLTIVMHRVNPEEISHVGTETDLDQGV